MCRRARETDAHVSRRRDARACEGRGRPRGRFFGRTRGARLKSLHARDALMNEAEAEKKCEDGWRRLGGRDARSSIVTRGFELAKGVERGAERERGARGRVSSATDDLSRAMGALFSSVMPCELSVASSSRAASSGRGPSVLFRRSAAESSMRCSKSAAVCSTDVACGSASSKAKGKSVSSSLESGDPHVVARAAHASRERGGGGGDAAWRVRIHADDDLATCPNSSSAATIARRFRETPRRRNRARVIPGTRIRPMETVSRSRRARAIRVALAFGRRLRRRAAANRVNTRWATREGKRRRKTVTMKSRCFVSPRPGRRSGTTRAPAIGDATLELGRRRRGRPRFSRYVVNLQTGRHRGPTFRRRERRLDLC